MLGLTLMNMTVVKEFMLTFDISVSEIAEAMDVNRSTVYRIIKNDKMCNVKEARVLMDLMSLELDELFDEDGKILMVTEEVLYNE